MLHRGYYSVHNLHLFSGNTELSSGEPKPYNRLHSLIRPRGFSGGSGTRATFQAGIGVNGGMLHSVEQVL